MKNKMFVFSLVCAFFLCGCMESNAKSAGTATQKAPAVHMVQESVAWVTSLSEGLKLAQTQKKPVMVDFFAEWCGWCKKLDKDVYTDPEVLELSKSFICVKVDTDKNGQDATKFGVQGLPTIAFLNPDGSVIDKLVGYNPAPKFAAGMKKALKK